jgi:hypothetical protein
MKIKQIFGKKYVFTLIILSISFNPGLVNSQDIVSNITEIIPALKYYSIEINITQSDTPVEIKFSCQNCEINFLIVDESNFTTWKIGNGAIGIIRLNVSGLEETFVIKKPGIWFLVWDNVGMTSQTINIEKIKLSTSYSNIEFFVVIMGAIIFSIIGTIFWRKTKNRNDTNEKNDNKGPKRIKLKK